MHLDKKIIIILAACTLTAGILGVMIGSLAGGNHDRGYRNERGGRGSDSYGRGGMMDRGQGLQMRTQPTQNSQPTAGTTTKSN